MYSQALRRAAEVLGGTEELRAYLNVSMLHLRLWMQGQAKPPDAIFLKVVDVLSGEQSRPNR